jgi:hypothetical protein
LPDGIFLNQKSQFGIVLESLLVEDAGIFCGLLAIFSAYWYILRQIVMFCGHLVYFSNVGMLCKEKSGNPAGDAVKLSAVQRSWQPNI